MENENDDNKMLKTNENVGVPQVPQSDNANLEDQSNNQSIEIIDNVGTEENNDLSGQDSNGPIEIIDNSNNVQPDVFNSAPTMDQPDVFNTAPTMEQPEVVNSAPTMEQPEVVNTTPTMEQPEVVNTAPTMEQPNTVNTTPTMEQPEVVNTTPTVEQPEVINSTPTMEQPEVTDKGKKRTGLKIALGVIVVIIVAAGLLYKFVILSNKRIFSSGVNAVYSGINKAINKADGINLLTNGNEFDGTLTFNTNNTAFEDFNSYSYNISTKIDTSNKRLNGSLSILNDSKSIMDLQADYQNQKQYVQLGDAYNKIIKLGDNDDDLDKLLDNTQSVDYDKLNSSIKDIKDIINKNITDDELVNGEETVKIGSNDYSLKYVSLKLTKGAYGDLISRIVNDIKNDSDLISNLVDSLGITESDVNTELDDIIKSADNVTFDNIEIKLYTDGILASVKGFDVIVDDTSTIKAIFMDDDKLIDINGVTYDFKYLNDKVTITDNGTEVFTGIINTANENKFDMDYTVVISDSKFSGNVQVETSTDGSNVNGKVGFSLIMDSTTYAIKLDYSIKSNTSISDIDESKVINAEDITESEYTTIYNKFVENFKGTAFEELISLFTSGIKTSITTNTNCANAVCISCSGDTCDCIYLDDYNASQSITCPNTTTATDMES